MFPSQLSRVQAPQKLIKHLGTSAADMTQSNGENPQRSRGGLQLIRDGIQSRSLLAKKRVESITKDDVKGFFIRNAFVIFTVAAVIIGKDQFVDRFFYLTHS